MAFGVCCWLSVGNCRSLRVVCCLLFVGFRVGVLFVSRCVLLVVCYLLFVISYLLFVVCCPLLLVGWSFVVVCCLLIVVVC